MGKGCLNDIQPIMKCMNDLFTSCFTFQKLKDLEALYMIINIYICIYIWFVIQFGNTGYSVGFSEDRWCMVHVPVTSLPASLVPCSQPPALQMWETHVCLPIKHPNKNCGWKVFKDSGNLYLTEINTVTTRQCGRQSMALDYMFQAFEWLGIRYCEPFSGSTNYRMFLGSLDRLIPSLSGSLGIQLCWVSHHVFLAWWNVPRYSGRALRNQHICTLATGLQGLGLYRECYWDQVSCESSVFQAYRCAMWIILCRKNYFGRKLILPGPIASTHSTPNLLRSLESALLEIDRFYQCLQIASCDLLKGPCSICEIGSPSSGGRH